jgi:hypothetical protein
MLKRCLTNAADQSRTQWVSQTGPAMYKPQSLISFRAKLHIVNAHFQNLFANVCCQEMMDQVFFLPFGLKWF